MSSSRRILAILFSNYLMMRAIQKFLRGMTTGAGGQGYMIIGHSKHAFCWSSCWLIFRGRSVVDALPLIIDIIVITVDSGGPRGEKKEHIPKPLPWECGYNHPPKNF